MDEDADRLRRRAELGAMLMLQILTAIREHVLAHPLQPLPIITTTLCGSYAAFALWNLIPGMEKPPLGNEEFMESSTYEAIFEACERYIATGDLDALALIRTQ